MRNMVFVVDKPTDPTGVTLESWAQGFLVGSLMVMAGVTCANMRRNVLLHKLIMIEVSTCRHHQAYRVCRTCKLTSISALLGHVTRHIHVCRAPSLQLVPECDFHPAQRILVTS
jgi:hypothetical protein